MRLAILAAALARGGRACTTVLVAPGATRDGGTIVSHNADCFNCDFRFGKVEPRLSTDPYSVFRYRPTFPHDHMADAPALRRSPHPAREIPRYTQTVQSITQCKR